MRVLGVTLNFFSLLRLKRRCCTFFTTLSVWVDHYSLSVMCTSRNLKLSPFSTAVWIWGCSLCCFLKSTIISLVLLMFSERLFSCHHTPRYTVYIICTVYIILFIFTAITNHRRTQGWSLSRRVGQKAKLKNLTSIK